MPKMTIEVDNNQVEKLIESLPAKEKLRLLRRMEKNAVGESWNEILKDINGRLKRSPISAEDIEKEIGQFRKKNNAQSRN